jgi:hypothetical protein
VGVERGDYTNSRDNKRYATRAIGLLRADDSLADDRGRLWSLVMKGEEAEKRHNSQMDVVISLWSEGLIREHY